MGSTSSKFKKYLQHGDEFAAMQIYQSSPELRKNLDPNLSYGENHNHNTALHYAAKHGMKHLLRTFLNDLGGNPNKKNGVNETVLHIACQLNQTKSFSAQERRAACVQLLLYWKGASLNNGSREKVDLSAQDKEGNTALHWAAQTGLKRCVELLLAHGAPLFVENNDKLTPCDLAMRGSHHDIARLLESRMVFVPVCCSGGYVTKVLIKMKHKRQNHQVVKMSDLLNNSSILNTSKSIETGVNYKKPSSENGNHLEVNGQVDEEKQRAQIINVTVSVSDLNGTINSETVLSNNVENISTNITTFNNINSKEIPVECCLKRDMESEVDSMELKSKAVELNFENDIYASLKKQTNASLNEIPDKWSSLRYPNENGKIVGLEEPKMKEYAKKQTDINKDYLIVRDIVMEHFDDVVKYIKEKLEKRRSYRKSPSLIDYLENEDKSETSDKVIEPDVFLDLHTNSNEGKFVMDQGYSFSKTIIGKATAFGNSEDSGLEGTYNISGSNNILDGSDDGLAYDEESFLNTALGEMIDLASTSNETLDGPFGRKSRFAKNRPISGTEKSVGTSHLSSLLSQRDTIYSSYSTVNKSTKKKLNVERQRSSVQPLFKHPRYESVEFIVDPKIAELTKEIAVLQETAYQASKAVALCKSQSKLCGSLYHLEAERVLLLSLYKKDTIEQTIKRARYGGVEDCPSYVTVEIKNLTFFATPKATSKDIVNYFICLISSGTTVYVSRLTLPERNGRIVFSDTFTITYSGTPTKLNLNIAVYAFTMGMKQSKVASCIPSCTSPLSTELEETYTHFLGKGKIYFDNIGKEHTLQDVVANSPLDSRFEAEIYIKLQLYNRITGFLNINVGTAMWRRRWCILEGFLIKYWSCPPSG